MLALLTFGEGWHNNHHFYPNSARQGFRWWELDISYYLLVVMSWLGLVLGFETSSCKSTGCEFDVREASVRRANRGDRYGG